MFAATLFSAEGTATGVRQSGKQEQVKIVSFDAGPNQGLLPDGSLPGGTKIEAVELTGLSLYYDRWWSDQWSSSAGYSFTEVDNTAGQTGDTYEKG